MKKYPYTEITDLIVYETKPKKHKKHRVWIPCLCSALAASVLTAGVCGYGIKNYVAPLQQQVQKMSTGAAGYTVTTLANGTVVNGKQVLTVPEIANKVGPSCVGVINKAKVQPQKYYDPFSGRYYYTSDPNSNELIEQGAVRELLFPRTDISLQTSTLSTVRPRFRLCLHRR